jgi:hypothetical protein
MNTVRIHGDRLEAGGGSARIDRGLPIAAVAVCAVFAGSFAIGRATNSGDAARAEAPSSLPAASVRAAVPIRLSEVPLIEIVPTRSVRARANPRRPSTGTTAVSARKRAVAREAPGAASPASQPQPSTLPAPEGASPSPAGGSAPPSSGSSGGGTGNPTHSASGGGSFDTSG